jgi:hypothetical protein
VTLSSRTLPAMGSPAASMILARRSFVLSLCRDGERQRASHVRMEDPETCKID